MNKNIVSKSNKEQKNNIVTKARLITTTTMLFSLIFLLCIYAIYSIYGIDRSIENIVKVNFVSVESSIAMKHNIEDQNKIVFDYVNNENLNNREIIDFKMYTDSFNENLEILKSSVTEEGELVAVRMIEDSYIEYNYAINKISSVENRSLYYYSTIHPMYKRICEEINYIQKSNVKSINMKNSLSKAEIDFSKTILTVLLIVAIIICIAISTKAITTADNMTNNLTQELIDVSEKLIFVVDKNFELLQINKKAENIIGRTETELLGKKITEFIDSEEINEYIINKGENGPLSFVYTMQQQTYETFIEIKETNLEYLIISCTAKELKVSM